jgi:hypothetical protein
VQFQISEADQNNEGDDDIKRRDILDSEDGDEQDSERKYQQIIFACCVRDSMFLQPLISNR